jgi:pilus assembly protein CpaC
VDEVMKKRAVHIFRGAAFLAVLVAICTGVIMPAIEGWAAKTDLISLKEAKAENIVELEFGKAIIIKINGDVSDVLVADPSIVDVVAVQSDRLYLVGLDYGDTNLMILNGQGDVLDELTVHVKLDMAIAEQYLQENWPNEDVSLRMLSDQLILTGTVSTPEVASQIKRVIGVYYMEIIDEEGEIDEWVVDLMKVRGEQQVMLRVRIVEVSRSILKELGTNSLTVSDYGDLLGDEVDEGTNGILRSVAGGASGGLQETGFGTLEVFSSLGAFGPIDIVFEALVDDGLATLLAEPNLTAISGEQAGFLAGGEFPVPSGRDSEGNVIIEFRDFGVSLNFVPTVYSEDRIVLQMQTEVSSLNRAESVTISGLEIPALDIRRASTVVEIGSGQSLMIAGLLQSEATQSLANIPGIDKTPVLGDLLKSESFQKAESELVVVVSPFVVKPYANKTHASNDFGPIQASSPLTQAFAMIVRRKYGADGDMVLAGLDGYGYILD